MIPLRDVIPSRTTPWMTLLLIALNAMVFAALHLVSDESQARALARGGLVPYASWIAIPISLFVHLSPLHAVGNLVALWLFGENVEDRLGHLRYVMFFLGTGSVAGLAELWFTTGTSAPIVGASGAIGGVIGAYLLMFPRSRLLVLVPTGLPASLIEVPVLPVAAAWFLLQAATGQGLVALFAGTATGVATVWLFRRPERDRVDWWSR